jgi:thiol peroxidase
MFLLRSYVVDDLLSSTPISNADYWREKLHFTMPTNGALPTVGNQAPDFCLTNSELENVTLATYAGKRKILNILPSLDVPSCLAFTRKLNHEKLNLENTVLLTISVDLPFAQRQFCAVKSLHDMETLSTFRSTFAVDYGVQIINGALAGLMAQAVVVMDEQNNIIHTQIATELADELNCESIIELLKRPLFVSSDSSNAAMMQNNRRDSFRISTTTSVRTPCYCNLQLLAPKKGATTAYKQAHILATNKIYEKLKAQRHSINTAIPDIAFANMMQLNLRDISSTGCSMMNHDHEFSYFLTPNTIYKNCTIHMPDGEEIKVSLKIMLQHRVENPHIVGFNEIIGVEFIDMTQAVESAISYYVREIERQRILSIKEHII